MTGSQQFWTYCSNNDFSKPYWLCWWRFSVLLMSLCNLIYNPVCACVFRVPTAAEVEKWKKSFSHMMNSERKCYISISHIKKKNFNLNRNKASNLMFESKDSGANKPDTFRRMLYSLVFQQNLSQGLWKESLNLNITSLLWHNAAVIMGIFADEALTFTFLANDCQ